MYAEIKKLNIIQEVLKINNQATLSALENFLKKSAKDENPLTNSGISEFSGIWSKEEAEEIQRIIEEACELVSLRS